MVCKVLADYLIVEKLNQCSNLWSGSAVQGLSNTASHEHSCDPHPCSAPQKNIWSSEKSSLACSWGQDNELLGWLKKSFRTAGVDLMKAEPEVFSYQKQWLLAKQLNKIKLNQSHSIFGANCLSATAPALLSSIKNKGKWERREKHCMNLNTHTEYWAAQPEIAVRFMKKYYTVHLPVQLNGMHSTTAWTSLDIWLGGKRGQSYWLWSIICSISVVVKEMLVLVWWEAWPLQTKECYHWK